MSNIREALEVRYSIQSFWNSISKEDLIEMLKKIEKEKCEKRATFI